MRLLNFAITEEPQKIRFGAWFEDHVIDLDSARTWAQGARNLPLEPLPADIQDYLYHQGNTSVYTRNLIQALEGADIHRLESGRPKKVAYSLQEVYLYPPVPRPTGIRDFYAFEQHVQTVHRARQKEVPEEWYQFPVFYYSNPNAVFGPFTAVPYPGYTQELDYELEVACVIGKQGINIPLDRVEEHIIGYTIMNDWSARDVQRLETRVGLGPAKAKDFATSLGPWLVTPDELADRATDRAGAYDLEMKARINGVERSCGNWKDIHFSFGEMIVRASQSTYLYPGDVIGSGTVGTGCLSELTLGKGPWLKVGDVVELEIERLGTLTNQVGESYPSGN